MNRVCLILFLALKSIYSLSQNDNKALSDELRTITNITRLENKLETLNEDFTKYKREELFGFGYTRYVTSAQLFKSHCTVYATKKGDTILSNLIVLDVYDKQKQKTVYDTIVNWTDSLFADKYIAEHNKIFGTGLSRANFGEKGCGMFGNGCGITGSPQPSMIRVCELANKLEKTKLYYWATSLNPQDRVHGVVGLLFTKMNGTPLTEKEKNVIKLNQKSEAIIDYCAGCAFGLSGTMKFLLSKKRIKYYYNWYTKSGWSRMYNAK